MLAELEVEAAVKREEAGEEELIMGDLPLTTVAALVAEEAGCDDGVLREGPGLLGG